MLEMNLKIEYFSFPSEARDSSGPDFEKIAPERCFPLKAYKREKILWSRHQQAFDKYANFCLRRYWVGHLLNLTKIHQHGLDRIDET